MKKGVYGLFKLLNISYKNKMILKVLKIETWIGDATNCYIVQDEKSKETMVIDPAGDVDKIIEMLDILQAKLKYIYLTHCHGDHIGGVKWWNNCCTKGSSRKLTRFKYKFNHIYRK